MCFNFVSGALTVAFPSSISCAFQGLTYDDQLQALILCWMPTYMQREPPSHAHSRWDVASGHNPQQHQTARPFKCVADPCRAEAERQRQLEAEQKAKEAEEQRLLAEAVAAKEAERRALDKLARRFAVKLDGSASIDKPPQVCLEVSCTELVPVYEVAGQPVAPLHRLPRSASIATK